VGRNRAREAVFPAFSAIRRKASPASETPESPSESPYLSAFESVGLTPALFALLNYLQSHENVIQQEIGAALGIDPSTMVALVDQLEDADLAKRRPRPEDRRAREVVLTAKGRQTLGRARELAKEVEGRVLHGLSPAERSQLVTLLRKAFAAAPPQPPWSFEEGD
jgi:DNA-binding MarR family transcriptional regulator